MSEASPHFNLIDEPWLPVVFRDGLACDLSLRELFERLPEIRCLMGDIPQQTVPMLRLCLAILYRAYARACEPDLTHQEMLDVWGETWESGSFDMDVIDSYLDEFHDRFDLFGERPFLQVPGLAYQSADKPYDPISEMLVDVPKLKKYLFSMRLKQGTEAISPAEAARWLLFFLAYDLAGIKPDVKGNTHAKQGKVYAPKGLPGVGWLGSIGSVFIEGESLFETLMLNLVLYDDAPYGGDLFGLEDDLSPWELPVSSPDYAAVSPTGPVNLFTMQSRRVRLVPNDSGDSVVGMVSCYGDVVRPTDAAGCETMTAWRESEQQQKLLHLPTPPLMPQTHVCSKVLWRGLGPLLAPAKELGERDLRPAVIRWVEELREEEIEGLPKTVRVHAQGIAYGSNASAFVDAYDDQLDLGDAMLRHDSAAVICAIETVARLDEAVTQLTYLVRSVELAAGDKRGGDSAKRVSDDVRERAYLALDELARDRLRNFTAEQRSDPYCQAWRDEARNALLRLGEAYVANSGASRFERREKGSITEAFNRYCGRLNEILGSTE